MSKPSDAELSAGLRKRKPQSAIEADVNDTIVAQMVADAMVLPMETIRPSPYQVRTVPEEDIGDLMESIKDTKGPISPVVVRPIGLNQYELIAGHTRYVACDRLGYTHIPAVVKPMNNAEAAKALAADNMIRTDLTDYEISKQLKVLFDNEFLKSNSEAARLLGHSRQNIIRYRAFDDLPQEIHDLLDTHRDLLSGTTVQELLLLIKEGYGEEVIDGCRRLSKGLLKTQIRLLSWIREQLATPDKQEEFVFTTNEGKFAGRLVVTSKGIRISGAKLDYERIAQLLREELPKLQRDI